MDGKMTNATIKKSIGKIKRLDDEELLLLYEERIRNNESSIPLEWIRNIIKYRMMKKFREKWKN